jgi:hypothetical protein
MHTRLERLLDEFTLLRLMWESSVESAPFMGITESSVSMMSAGLIVERTTLLSNGVESSLMENA